MNPNKNNRATDYKPWTVFAGTIVKNANGMILFSACEESELRGGDFDSIRMSLRESVYAVNLLPHYEAVVEAANNLNDAIIAQKLTAPYLEALRVALATLTQAKAGKGK